MASLVSRQSSASPSKISPTSFPNLPGFRRNPVGSSRVFKDKNLPSSGLALDEPSTSSTFFADMDAFDELSASVLCYPEKAQAYNDTTGRYSLRSQAQDRALKTRSLPFSTLNSVPSFVVDDQRICRFIAIFEDFVPVNINEPFRTRKVHISYFLEDNTIEIIEPLEPNTGLMQGKILRRHQVVKPISDDPSPEISIYMVTDFMSGSEITIYNRVYKVIDCDERTRKILNDIDLEFGESLPMPSNYFDPSSSRSISTPHKNSELFSQSAKTATNETKAFFRNNGEVVLRFYAVWDDRASEYGRLNRMRILFYVNDGTMEILQDFENNDGRDRVPKVLKRMRVVKPSNSPLLDDSSLSYTMEDIKDDEVIYSWTDFRIGGFISVIGIDIQILDADRFTRQFFERNSLSLGPAISIPSQTQSFPKRIIPPHNGFGSDEDSLQTCTGRLIPSPIRKDISKSKRFAGQVLRFKSRILNARGADRTRTFVFQVHMEDDTVQIREPPVTNSGFKGGRFMAREKVRRDESSFIVPADAKVGAVITVHSYDFLLEECDEFTHKFMESMPEVWPECSLQQILRKLRQSQNDVARIVLTSPGSPSRDASYAELERVLSMRAGVSLTPQEMITLQRSLDPEKRGLVKFAKLVSMLRAEDGSGGGY